VRARLDGCELTLGAVTQVRLESVDVATRRVTFVVA
jgi:hypothetical protein